MSLCLSLNSDKVERILHYLLTINVKVYGGGIDQNLSDKLKTNRKNPSIKTITTRLGQNFNVMLNSYNEEFGTKPRITYEDLRNSNIKSSSLRLHRTLRLKYIMNHWPCQKSKEQVADILKLKYSNKIKWQ